MGVVYKAEQPVTGRIVALKLCRPADILLDIAGADRIRQLFLEEARAMGRARHPNIASVLDTGEHPLPGIGTMPFFTMEYFCNNLGLVLGEEYEAQQHTRLLAVPRALDICRQTLEALRRMHHDGMIHRDVKPFNIMLTDEGRVVLIDFGLSRLRGEEPTARPRGMVVGSPFYAAPEQEADPEQADARADLYSVGVLLYRALTGQLPGSSLPSVSPLREELDTHWDAAFATLLHPDPAKRPQTAGHAQALLHGLEAHWRQHRTEVCALHDPALPAPSGPPRARPARVRPKQALEFFRLDPLWRPRHSTANRIEPLDHTDGALLDRATGLLWQGRGSEFPLDYAQAQEYVAQLRSVRSAGRDGWRLPTVDELATLFLDRAEPGSFCLDPAFGSDKARLWSADQASYTAAWYVDADMGFVGRQDHTCAFYVRAVCAMKSA